MNSFRVSWCNDDGTFTFTVCDRKKISEELIKYALLSELKFAQVVIVIVKGGMLCIAQEGKQCNSDIPTLKKAYTYV